MPATRQIAAPWTIPLGIFVGFGLIPAVLGWREWSELIGVAAATCVVGFLIWLSKKLLFRHRPESN